MAADWPSTDTRRASKLREALEKSAPMLAPEWAGLRHQGDFGRALVEIAARLAEHSTSRLDRTALRDKLAFLDALDVATPPPQSAIVPIVFTLAEKREAPVSAPARVRLYAKGDPEDIDFETRAAIDLTPARLVAVIAVDPAADRIESAPAFVTGGLAVAAPPTRYMLLSAVEAGAKALQLVQAVGIEPDDLLRLGGTAYRVEKAEGTIVQLRDPVAGSAPAGAAVEKLLALEAFDLRDLQEHAAYIGHKELLKLDGPAEITLAFDPPTLPSRLAGLDVEYSMWGTAKNESDPAWHPLHLIGAGRGGLRLAKDWEGGVDELDVAGCASRWIRLRLKSPIAGACGPATSTVSVELKVESALAEEDKQEGSQTIAAAFYNGQPLPTSSAFFPFGPEPQRFDVFALSAPEALSKKGARVTLTLGLDDASLHAMAYPDGEPDHVYGVSANGRLQSVRFGESKAADWRQLGLAPEGNAAGAAADATIRLDAGAPLYVLHVGASQDLVFVRDVNELIRSARIDTTGDNWTVGEWRSLPSLDNKAFLGFCLIPAPAAQSAFDGVAARLVAVAADALYLRYVINGGYIYPYWFKIESDLGFADPLSITLAEARADGATLALIDSAGKIHRGEFAFALNRVTWNPFAEAAATDPKADPAIRPVAWLEGSDLMVAAARDVADDPQGDPLLVMHEELGEDASPRDDLRVRLGNPKSILAVGWGEDGGPDRPLIVVTGTAGILLWAEGQAEVAELPGDASPASPYGLLLPGGDGDEPPSLLLNAGSELLLHERIWTGTEEVEVELHDIIWRDEGGTVPSHVLVDKSAPPEPLPGPWLSNDVESAHRAPGALDPGDEYVLLEDLAKTYSGTARDPGDSKKMPLAAGDKVTDEGDFLEIDGKTFEVANLSGTTKVATVDRNLPSGPLSYSVYRPTEASPRTFAGGDRKRLAELDAEAPLGADELIFPSPADPQRQPVVDASGEWLLLGEEWDDEPVGDEARLTSEPRLDPHAQIRLPRHADNPELSWEYYDGDGWRRLDSKAEWGFADRTLNLAKSGDISFQVPKDLSPTEIAGKEDYWIRARLVGGDYGRPAYVVTNVPPTGSPIRTSITIDRSRLNPPEIISIEANYVLEQTVPPDCVVADNNLAAIDQTQAALEDGAVFNLFEGVAQHVGDADGGSRAVYLGFGRAPRVSALNFYADAVDRDSAPRPLLAEALTRDGWRRIGTDDETAALTRPGMLRLYLHPPPEQLPLFGRDGWWLRLRPGQDSAGWAPVLRGLFVNAVAAEHAKSVSQEILGSSLGEPDQSYRLAQTPVLPATLELRVRESLGREEREAIEKKVGRDAIKDEDPNLPGQWVLWQRVDTFVDEDGDARVYRLDPATGEVRFGNGRCGKVPPAGRDSIRAFSYQKGGGSAGNVPARAIDNLSSAIESVEQAINPVDAAGGADAPRVERLAVTAPALLRHAGRALAPADIEALAVESAPDVVRARCLARKGCGIALAVAIRATGTRCPVPTRARREGIARNIVAAGWGALAPGSVTVHPPRYVHVTVDAVVAASAAEAVAGVERDVRAALTDFLHSLDGGPDGLGWPFGRRVWPSDLQRAIAGVEGLDRVISLDLAAKNPRESLDAMPPDGLICVEEDDIAIVVEPPEDGR